MSKSKKILYISTAGVLVLLIIFTVLSKIIFDALMPVVEVIKPVSMELEINGGETRIYNAVIPYDAIIPGEYGRNYVYIVRERKGLFGQEHYCVLVEVILEGYNDLYAALGGWSVTVYDDVVLSSSRFLAVGEVVRVN